MEQIKSSLRENKKQILETIQFIEDRLEDVQNKIIKAKTDKMIKTLDVLIDGKNDLSSVLENKNDELNKINQRIRDIEQYGEINPFDFSNISQDNDVESDLSKLLEIAENNVVLFENDIIGGVVNNVMRDKYPFILKGEKKINEKDPTSVNNFYKNVEALNQWIEKINDNYDETLSNNFTGEVIKYTKTFNKIKRSNYGTGCDAFKKIVEYRGNLCYILEENECFHRNLEFIYNKDFSQQYLEFIKQSHRNKNIMTSAKNSTLL